MALVSFSLLAWTKVLYSQFKPSIKIGLEFISVEIQLSLSGTTMNFGQKRSIWLNFGLLWMVCAWNEGRFIDKVNERLVLIKNWWLNCILHRKLTVIWLYFPNYFFSWLSQCALVVLGPHHKLQSRDGLRIVWKLDSLWWRHSMNTRKWQ